MNTVRHQQNCQVCDNQKTRNKGEWLTKRVQLLQIIYPIGIEEKVKYSVSFQ